MFPSFGRSQCFMKSEEKEAGNQMKMSEDSYSCCRCQQGNGGAHGKCLEADRT